jgi:putative hydrolase of the HAD superfamily
LKKAYIFDLDNTIYPVASIADELFAPLFQLIKNSDPHEKDFEAIKFNIMRKPFQVVATQYDFSQALIKQATELLKQLTYAKKMFPYDDYACIKEIPADRFLVTTGFTNMQQSKVRQLGIERDFKEIHIIDPTITQHTKKDVFAGIRDKYNYSAQQMVIIGDDPDSEIRAGNELTMDTVLYDKNNLHPHSAATYTITDFKKLFSLFAQN